MGSFGVKKDFLSQVEDGDQALVQVEVMVTPEEGERVIVNTIVADLLAATIAESAHFLDYAYFLPTHNEQFGINFSGTNIEPTTVLFQSSPILPKDKPEVRITQALATKLGLKSGDTIDLIKIAKIEDDLELDFN